MKPSRPSSTLDWRPWEAIALACIIGLAGWLRWPHLSRGILGDEQALLQFHGWEVVWRNSLTTLHPPLYRLSFRLFLEPLATVEVARSFSLLFALVFIAVLAAFTRSIAGSRIAGLVAALWVSFIPTAIIFSALFRPYSLLVLLFVAHAWAITRWIDDEFKLKYSIPTVLTALILPQTHYISVLWLSAMGVSLVICRLIPWRKLWVYIPAAVLFSPLGWLILTAPASKSDRRAGNQLDSLEYLLGMGLSKNGRTEFASPLTLACLVLLVLLILNWRRWTTATRVCILGGLSICAAVLTSTTQHSMTSSTKILGMMFWIPLLVNSPLLLQQWIPRAKLIIFPLAAFAAYSIGNVTWHRYTQDKPLDKGHNRLQVFLDHWDDYVPEGHDVGFLEATDQRVSRLVLTDTLHTQSPISGCGDDKFCFKMSDRYWRKISTDDIPADKPMAIIWTRHTKDPELPAHCSVFYSGEKSAGVAHCGTEQP